MAVKYIKYTLNYELIFEILKKLNKRKINFFIDIQSICKGFYNKEILYIELDHYIKNRKVSDMLINELKEYLNDLYRKFKSYDPFFILFYDNGYNLQNLALNPAYKQGRTQLNTLLEDDDLRVFREIKQYYFKTIQEKFEKENLSKIFYLKKYESDLIPHFCIMNDYYDSNQSDVLNIILSVDKDLLQTCQFTNTIQCITSFKSDPETRKYNIHFGIYDNVNAIGYFNKKFKSGILTAKHIPMILSIAGDKSDSLPGIKGYGAVKACDLMITYNIPFNISDLLKTINTMPEIIKQNIDIIKKNFELISFEQQIKRLPPGCIIYDS